MKLLLIALLITISTSVSAVESYLKNLPTTYQELTFSIATLKQYLEPMGYTLDEESVTISDGIAISGLSVLAYVMTPEFVIKNLSFQAKSASNKLMSGHIYLAVANAHIEEKLKLHDLNSTAKKYQSVSPYTNDDFILLLSRGYAGDSFEVDLSPQDFHLLSVENFVYSKK